MRHIGDKLPLRAFHLFDPGDVVQHNDRAAAGSGRRRDLDDMPRQYRYRPPFHPFARFKCNLHAFQHLRRAYRLHQRIPCAHRAVGRPHQLLHRLVRPHDASCRVDGGHRILHRIQQRFQLAHTFLHAVQLGYQTRARRRECLRHLGQLAHFFRGWHWRHRCRQLVDTPLQVIRLVHHRA